MSYDELRRYIHDLEQSGFDVVRLRVHCKRKSPIPDYARDGRDRGPFALQCRKEGRTHGRRHGDRIGVVYWTVSGLFEPWET